MTAVRVGLVGLGRLSEVAYVPALRALESANLVAVADVREARCAFVAPGLPAYPDTAALVADADVELVIVASPPSTHLEAARAAARAGVASLVEKPPAESLADAVALAELDPEPWMGLNRRFDPGVEGLRRSVLALRPPLGVSIEMSIRPDTWGAVDAVPGPLLDVAPHLADLTVWLTGRDCVAVRAHRVDEGAACFEVMLDEGRALVSASHEGAWRESIVIRDAAGDRVRLTRGGRPRRVAGRLGWRRTNPLVATLASQLGAVCAALRTGAADERLATAADGVAVMGILEAAASSARRDGPWVELAADRESSCLR
jgi:predicted dehydrogenase